MQIEDDVTDGLIDGNGDYIGPVPSVEWTTADLRNIVWGVARGQLIPWRSMYDNLVNLMPNAPGSGGSFLAPYDDNGINPFTVDL